MKAWRRFLGVAVLVAILLSIALGSIVVAQGERGGERPDPGRRDRCDAIARRLREMVENGELTREEAAKRYFGACGDRCDAIALRLREAVENGELTVEEARERYRAVCGERGRERTDPGRRDRCEAIARRLREMVERGELTPEEARERYRAACGAGRQGNNEPGRVRLPG